MVVKSKVERLTERLAQNKAALQKKQLALQKATTNLAALKRRRRTWLLIRYGVLFEEAEMVDFAIDELSVDRGLIIGFLCALRTGRLTAEEIERYRRIGKEQEAKRFGEHRTHQSKNCAD